MSNPLNWAWLTAAFIGCSYILIGLRARRPEDR